ncbi:GntR family transcriptional regulator [Celeribacter halophilus]|uniref:GntR family transcriptional regulator n=1 Tax=Celeribacter halophilus TaxID=576117 RepID=UPI0026E3435F|nr:GntR family transcriptional regulator [Celeribacter halophilus]MDO6725112.1 GntR family transcriptional regulator [Celeribacter halophilus]
MKSEEFSQLGTVSRQPKYRIVEEYLRKQIGSGELSIGDILPTEEELCTQFGVSRATVRTALGNIRSDGLITRSPAIGSRVVATSSKQEFSASWNSFDDLLHYAKNVKLSVEDVDKIIVDSELSKALQFDVGRRLVCVNGVRIAQGSSDPTCIIEVYFDALYSGVLDYIDDSDKPLAALIEDLYQIRINSIRQEISAEILSEKDAAKLQVEAGGAALVVERWYQDAAGKLFEKSRAIYPGHMLRHSMTLGRSVS